MFWADLKDYGERTADGPAYGFTVALHDHETYGSTIASGYFMSPGSMYKVDVSLKRVRFFISIFLKARTSFLQPFPYRESQFLN